MIERAIHPVFEIEPILSRIKQHWQVNKAQLAGASHLRVVALLESGEQVVDAARAIAADFQFPGDAKSQNAAQLLGKVGRHGIILVPIVETPSAAFQVVQSCNRLSYQFGRLFQQFLSRRPLLQVIAQAIPTSLDETLSVFTTCSLFFQQHFQHAQSGLLLFEFTHHLNLAAQAELQREHRDDAVKKSVNRPERQLSHRVN